MKRCMELIKDPMQSFTLYFQTIYECNPLKNKSN
jgi:hypothetical protein